MFGSVRLQFAVIIVRFFKSHVHALLGFSPCEVQKIGWFNTRAVHILSLVYQISVRMSGSFAWFHELKDQFYALLDTL